MTTKKAFLATTLALFLRYQTAGSWGQEFSLLFSESILLRAGPTMGHVQCGLGRICINDLAPQHSLSAVTDLHDLWIKLCCACMCWHGKENVIFHCLLDRTMMIHMRPDVVMQSHQTLMKVPARNKQFERYNRGGRHKGQEISQGYEGGV